MVAQGATTAFRGRACNHGNTIWGARRTCPGKSLYQCHYSSLFNEANCSNHSSGSICSVFCDEKWLANPSTAVDRNNGTGNDCADNTQRATGYRKSPQIHSDGAANSSTGAADPTGTGAIRRPRTDSESLPATAGATAGINTAGARCSPDADTVGAADRFPEDPCGAERAEAIAAGSTHAHDGAAGHQPQPGGHHLTTQQWPPATTTTANLATADSGPIINVRVLDFIVNGSFHGIRNLRRSGAQTTARNGTHQQPARRPPEAATDVRGSESETTRKFPSPSVLSSYPSNANLSELSQPKAGSVPCRYWREGKCLKGEDCTFRHDPLD